MRVEAQDGGKVLCRLLVAALALSLVACAGQRQLYIQESTAEQLLNDGLEQSISNSLPALPLDNGGALFEPLPRESSIVYTWRLLGEEYFNKSDLAMPNPPVHRMELLSTNREAAWVIYEFHGLLPEDTPRSVTFTIVEPLPLRYYVFLPDYSAEIWRWQAAETTLPAYQIDLSVWPNLVSPDGTLFLAVVSWGNQPTLISEVKLEIDLAGPAPEHVRASDGEYPSRVAVEWSQVPTATQYVVYRNGQEEEHIIAQTDSETLGYDDESAANLDVYTYWVRAKFLDEHGRFSECDTGFRNGWQRYSIDVDGVVGLYASMVVIDGKPALSYYDFSNGNLKFARALTDTPMSGDDWQVHIVDFNYQVGEFTSLAVLDGKPIISYFDNDQGKGNLKYARAMTATPVDTTDWRYHSVDTEGWVGEHNSLAVLDGLPAISYYDYTNTQLKYARALTATPGSATDWQTHAVDNSGQTGRFTSLAVVDGKPAISYYSDSTTDLRYARAIIGAPSDNQDWRIHIVDGEIDVGLYTSLALLGDKPMICYYDWSVKNLKFAIAQITAPASSDDWTSHYIVNDGTVCLYPSLESFNGKPVMSFYGNGGLYYARALNSSPASIADWQILPVDSSGAAGNYSSLVFLNDLPAIAYYGNPGLMFASTP